MAFEIAQDATVNNLLQDTDVAASFQDIITTELTKWQSSELSTSSQQGADLFAEFIKWVQQHYQMDPEKAVLKPIFAAWQSYKALKLQSSIYKKSLTAHLKLTASDEARLAFVSQIQPAQRLHKLTQPYPPKGLWWYERDDIFQRWHDTLMFGKQADTHKKHHPLTKVDPQKLQWTVNADQNAIICDADTGDLVLMVVQNFCPDADVLNWADSKVKEIVDYKRSVRVCTFLL